MKMIIIIRIIIVIIIIIIIIIIIVYLDKKLVTTSLTITISYRLSTPLGCPCKSCHQLRTAP